jgi:hypothetical protein
LGAGSRPTWRPERPVDRTDQAQDVRPPLADLGQLQLSPGQVIQRPGIPYPANARARVPGSSKIRCRSQSHRLAGPGRSRTRHPARAGSPGRFPMKVGEDNEDVTMGDLAGDLAQMVRTRHRHPNEQERPGPGQEGGTGTSGNSGLFVNRMRPTADIGHRRREIPPDRAGGQDLIENLAKQRTELARPVHRQCVHVREGGERTPWP